MQNGKVVAYVSHQLKAHEKVYPTHELELAILIFFFFTLKIWRCYFYGVKFEIYSEYKTLKYFFTQLDLNLRQQRKVEYDFILQYHPRKANIIVVALSRKPHQVLASLSFKDWKGSITTEDYYLQLYEDNHIACVYNVIVTPSLFNKLSKVNGKMKVEINLELVIEW